MGKHNKYDTINVFNLKDINVYYGIPNCYTSYSLGSSSLNDTLNYVYKNHFDFLMITDKNSFLPKPIYYNENTITRWNYSCNLLKRFQKKKENFIVFQGFEAKIIPYGDINVINPIVKPSSNLPTIKLPNISLVCLTLSIIKVGEASIVPHLVYKLEELFH